jgi:hypothetical protein
VSDDELSSDEVLLFSLDELDEVFILSFDELVCGDVVMSLVRLLLLETFVGLSLVVLLIIIMSASVLFV